MNWTIPVFACVNVGRRIPGIQPVCGQHWSQEDRKMTAVSGWLPDVGTSREEVCLSGMAAQAWSLRPRGSPRFRAGRFLWGRTHVPLGVAGSTAIPHNAYGIANVERYISCHRTNERRRVSFHIS
jgi:hypothetical protein